MKRWVPILFTLAFFVRFQGCAGDGDIYRNETIPGEAASLADGLIIQWDAPTSYTDSTQLDPTTELDVYEIYVNQTGMFNQDDDPSVYVSAIDSTGNANESFNLGNLDYPFSEGQTYHVSMRSVSHSGSRSEFSLMVTFTIRTGSDPASDFEQFLCNLPEIHTKQPAT